MEKETEEKINQLQMLEQGMQSFILQKQQLQIQLVEAESALKELETAEKSYKIVGNIMISADKEQLVKDIKDKKERIELRLNSIEKQEKAMREKANSVQQDVLKKLKK
jgi:prefoldin beta subunit